MFVNGVGVVLSGTLEDYAGMSIAWMTKVERDHVVLSLPKKAKGTQRVTSTGRFTLSLLSESQRDIARLFGGAGSHSVPGPVDLVETDWGMPAIGSSCAVYLCDVVTTQALNDQVVVMVRMTGPVYETSASPLVYNEEDYR